MITYQNIAVLYNPTSGSGMANKWALQFERTFWEREAGFTGTIALREIPYERAAYHTAKHLAERGCDLLVVIGGDGTINQVAAGIMDAGSSTTLGILPGGSVNNFARALRIPLAPLPAMNNLWSGTTKAVDIGKVNNRYMISSLTVGLLADIAIDVTAEEKRQFGPLAFLKNSFHVLQKNRSYPLELTFDNGVMVQKTKILLITMTNSVGGIDYFNPEAKPDDGYFHVYSLSDLSLWKMLVRMPYFFYGNFKDIPEVSYIKTSSLSISRTKGKRPILTRIDGDPSCALPVKMKVIHQGLRVIVPQE